MRARACKRGGTLMNVQYMSMRCEFVVGRRRPRWLFLSLSSLREAQGEGKEKERASTSKERLFKGGYPARTIVACTGCRPGGPAAVRQGTTLARCRRASLRQ